MLMWNNFPKTPTFHLFLLTYSLQESIKMQIITLKFQTSCSMRRRTCSSPVAHMNCFFPACAGSMAHARSVPGHTAPGDARVSGPEDHKEAASQSDQERLPGGDPADLLWSSARLPGQNESRRPSLGKSMIKCTCSARKKLSRCKR